MDSGESPAKYFNRKQQGEFHLVKSRGFPKFPLQESWLENIHPRHQAAPLASKVKLGKGNCKRAIKKGKPCWPMQHFTQHGRHHHHQQQREQQQRQQEGDGNALEENNDGPHCVMIESSMRCPMPFGKKAPGLRLSALQCP